MYQRAWATFNEFHAHFYEGFTITLPVSTCQIALFISYLSARKMAPATIMSYMSALGYVHKMRGLTDPTKSFLIQKLLTAIGRNRKADIRLPISRPVLYELVRSLKVSSYLRPRNARYIQQCF